MNKTAALMMALTVALFGLVGCGDGSAGAEYGGVEATQGTAIAGAAASEDEAASTSATASKGEVALSGVEFPSYKQVDPAYDRERGTASLAGMEADDFAAYIDLLEKEGYVFWTNAEGLDEKTAVDRHMWEAVNEAEEVHLLAMLMLDPKIMTTSINLQYKPLDA